MEIVVKISARITSVVFAVVGFCGLGSALFAGGHIEFGPADPMTIDQPRVAVEVYIPDPEHSFGPDISNYWLLDTGAQSILAAQTATSEMVSLGYETNGTFLEYGIGGSSTYDVSKTYNVDFAGTNGQRNTLADVQILSSTSANYGSFGGIVGTPAMVNRVTTMDLPAMLTEYQIGVAFSTTIPASSGHRYSVPLEFKHFGHSDQTNPPTTLPVYKPIPFATVGGRHSGGSASGDFVLDTGAQLSMLSTQFAFDLGLDTDGDGNFDNEKVGDQAFGGAGGSTVFAPLLQIEKIMIQTNEGVTLIWTDLTLPVLDIDPSINGIFGNDLLTSGWFAPVFESMLSGEPSEDHGYIDYVHFDFTDSDNLNGTMLLDLNPVYDNVIPDPLLSGDANRDGVVSASDYASVQANFGASGEAGIVGDANGDGVVSASDYASVQANFGNTTSSLTVPEPATIFMLGFGIVAIVRRRK
jgi:hypothetical protein